MKNILINIGLLLLIVACKKDDPVATLESGFSVTVKQNVKLPFTVTSKENIVFDLTINADSTQVLKEAVLSLDEAPLQTVTAAAARQLQLQYTYKASASDVGKSLIFRLRVSDEAGNTIDRDFTVYVQLAPANISIQLPADAPAEIADNKAADFLIQVNSENDIKYIKTFLDQAAITSLTKESFSNPKNDSYRFVYQPGPADADKTLLFTIEVMDVMGNIAKQQYSLSVKRSQVVDFINYFDVNLGAQRSTAYGPFFNASNGEVYLTTEAKAKAAGIDLVTFYSGSSFAYNITSPTLAAVAANVYTVAAYGDNAIANWPVKNQTWIKKITLTREEFDLLGAAAAIESLYTGATVAESETSGSLANGNVVVFKTAAGKYGVLYVKSRSANANTGYLTVDIKMQK